jgi:hypothetical protein
MNPRIVIYYNLSILIHYWNYILKIISCMFRWSLYNFVFQFWMTIVSHDAQHFSVTLSIKDRSIIHQKDKIINACSNNLTLYLLHFSTVLECPMLSIFCYFVFCITLFLLRESYLCLMIADLIEKACRNFFHFRYHYITTYMHNHCHCLHLPCLPLPTDKPVFKCKINPSNETKKWCCATKRFYNSSTDVRLCYFISLISLSWIIMWYGSLCVNCFCSSAYHWWHGNGCASVEACSTRVNVGNESL